MSSSSDSCKSSSSSSSSKCKGCVCKQLKKIQTGTVLDLFLKGGTVIEDVVFVNFNRDNCCAYFSDCETEPGSVIVVDCNDIQAIRFEGRD